MKNKKNFLISRFFLIFIVILFLISCKKEEVVSNTITDVDGNIYHYVKIGTQTWVVENLRTTKYNDGIIIPNVTNNSTWINTDSGGYCSYNNTTNIDTIKSYGLLYNWFAVNSGKLCPKGWHVPTKTEFTTLINYLGGDSSAINKLQEVGLKHWTGYNSKASNSSGFTAIPGGARDLDGSFNRIGSDGYWWSSTEANINNSNYLFISINELSISFSGKTIGSSVRCIKDN